jgi:23S rRNA pseudouridine1911/1915/1917 synthase
LALVSGFSRQALHAAVLGFEHPISGKKMRFEAPYPTDFKTLLEALEKDG